jgi:hypothetical protein
MVFKPPFGKALSAKCSALIARSSAGSNVGAKSGTLAYTFAYYLCIAV